MKRSVKATAVAVAIVAALGGLALVGCGSSDLEPQGSVPVMPAGHEGRYVSLGAEGCYGCHGANDNANPQLTGATALPADHYTVDDPTSIEDLSGDHYTCNLCHVQG